MGREYQNNSPAIPSAKRYERRHDRKTVNLAAQFSPVDIKENIPTNLSTIDGFIRNLSPAGMFVHLPMLYRVGTRFQVRIPLDGTLLTFYSIVWRVDLPSEAAKSKTYGHGMKVTTASDETMTMLYDFVYNAQTKIVA